MLGGNGGIGQPDVHESIRGHCDIAGRTMRYRNPEPSNDRRSMLRGSVTASLPRPA